MPFFENSLDKLISKIPIFKYSDGTTLEIKIETKDSSIIYILIKVQDESKHPIRLQELNKLQLEYFLQEYRNFIISGKYNKAKSAIGELQSAIQIALTMLKNKKISKFYFSLHYGLPLNNMINKIYTIDTFDNRCIALTEINKGHICNIIDQNTLNYLVPLFHNLSMRMIYDISLNESKYYSQIFEKMKIYLRIIVPAIISISIITNLTNNLHSDSIGLPVYIVMLIISLFPNILFRVIINLFIYFFINKSSLISYIEEKIDFLKKRLQ